MAKFRTGDIPQFKDVNDVASYLYQMQEQLGYVLSHLETDNFTESEWNAIMKPAVIDSIPASDSSNAVSSGGVYDALAGKQPKSDNLTEIGQYGLTKPGRRYGVIPYVKSDGGMEIGGYIDFHGTSNDTGDFTQRMAYGEDGFILGNISGGGSTGFVGKVTRTAGSMGRNCDIYGQCFCTCLGNGNFRFDISGKWYVASSVTHHDYGISKDFLRRAVYNNINGNTGGLVNLNFMVDGECFVFSASDYTLGHPNIDYGWSIQAQTYSYCLARMYTQSGDNGGWPGNTVNSIFPSGFFFRATIWAKIT